MSQFRKLVQEAAALFGATHYNEYHFLWTLSDQIGFEGIEHYAGHARHPRLERDSAMPDLLTPILSPRT